MRPEFLFDLSDGASTHADAKTTTITAMTKAAKRKDSVQFLDIGFQVSLRGYLLGAAKRFEYILIHAEQNIRGQLIEPFVLQALLRERHAIKVLRQERGGSFLIVFPNGRPAAILLGNPS